MGLTHLVIYVFFFFCKNTSHPSASETGGDIPIPDGPPQEGDPSSQEIPQVRRSTRIRDSGLSPGGSQHKKTRSTLDKVRVNMNASWLGEQPPYKVGRWKRSKAQRVGTRDNY